MFRKVNVFIAILIFAFVTGAMADDVWIITPTRTSSVETMKDFPGLIQLSVTKNGAPAPDGTKVSAKVLEGDTLLYGADKKNVGNSVDVTTKNGAASVSVLMQKAPKVLLLLSVTDGANVVAQKPFEFSSTDDIPTGDQEKCAKDDISDCRDEDTTFTFYTGYAVNTFAAPALSGSDVDAQKRNATSQDVIGGIDFSHRIFKRGTTQPRHGELWVYGETLHGLQSTNNCSGAGQNTENAQCSNTTPNSVNGIIQGARTLEAYAGLRWEPYLAMLDQTGSRLYVKGEVGFISLVGHGSDLIDNHHGGIGILKVHGRFTDSYFEVGYGRNDLFAAPRNKGRWKFDGFVEMNTKWDKTALIRPFLEMTADTDFGRGGDSVQSFFGLDFDLTLLKIFSVPGH